MISGPAGQPILAIPSRTSKKSRLPSRSQPQHPQQSPQNPSLQHRQSHGHDQGQMSYHLPLGQRTPENFASNSSATMIDSSYEPALIHSPSTPAVHTLQMSQVGSHSGNQYHPHQGSQHQPAQNQPGLHQSHSSHTHDQNRDQSHYQRHQQHPSSSKTTSSPIDLKPPPLTASSTQSTYFPPYPISPDPSIHTTPTSLPGLSDPQRRTEAILLLQRQEIDMTDEELCEVVAEFEGNVAACDTYLAIRKEGLRRLWLMSLVKKRRKT